MTKDIDVLGIGNAIVDVLSRCEDNFLEERDIDKGAMILVDEAQAEALYAQMGPTIEVSGGSAGNTIAGIAALGGKAAYVGSIADDQLGAIYAHDIRSLGVEFETAVDESGIATARSFILVTPDGQRTMNTFLGACQNLGPDDIEEEQIKRAKVVYMEGYLWDPVEAKKAFIKAMDIASANGSKVSLTLSDSFCVGRYRDEFLDLVENRVDILFANEDEIISLYEASSFEDAVSKVKTHAEVAILTRSEKGAVILSGDEHIEVPAHPTTVEDTTGAGDLYAGGFLYGYTQGYDLETCGKIAAVCAAEIISHIGARPEVDLKELIAKHVKL